jgi:hypothetical protein
MVNIILSRRVQVNPDGLKFNVTHQILVYAKDVNIFGGNIHTYTENADALVVATKKTGLEVNAETAKYTVISQDQNARCCHNIKIGNGFFEGVEQFK